MTCGIIYSHKNHTKWDLKALFLDSKGAKSGMSFLKGLTKFCCELASRLKANVCYPRHRLQGSQAATCWR